MNNFGSIATFLKIDYNNLINVQQTFSNIPKYTDVYKTTLVSKVLKFTVIFLYLFE